MKQIPFLLAPALAVLAASCAGLAAQAIPSGMAYQGRLADSSSSPLPDGTGYEIEVRLWSAPAGGTLLWGARYSGIPVKNGAFNLVLGAAGGFPLAGASAADIMAAFNASPAVHLAITVTKGASGAVIAGPTEILPRQQILSAPFAFRAGVADAVQADSLTSLMIKDGEVKTPDIAAGAVQTSLLADQVVTSAKIADGTITSVDIAAQAISPDRLSHHMALIVDEKPSGTAGGTALTRGWTRRDLNKVIYSVGDSITLGSNSFTLKTGSYLIEASAPTYETDVNRLAVRRTGEIDVLILGSTSRSTGGAIPYVPLRGVLTVANSTETFEICILRGSQDKADTPPPPSEFPLASPEFRKYTQT